MAHGAVIFGDSCQDEDERTLSVGFGVNTTVPRLLLVGNYRWQGCRSPGILERKALGHRFHDVPEVSKKSSGSSICRRPREKSVHDR